MNEFRVLLVYPNLMLVGLLPNSIALLAGCLKEAGFEVRVFDTTPYQTSDKTVDEMRVERMQVREFDLDEVGIAVKKENVYEDFARMVREYQPNLIGLTVLDNTVKQGLDLVRRAHCDQIPVVLGGVHATFNSELLLQNKEVDFICRGEGEETLVELCCALRDHRSFDHIQNLWVKKENDNFTKNSLRPPIDLNRLPFEDFSVFEPKRLFRPMQGKMLAMLPVNIDRGCPYSCAFCDAPALTRLYQACNSRYYRIKSVDRIYAELKYQI
ncbi:unnamed protein product, partial [marine sediment metagenome]